MAENAVAGIDIVARLDSFRAELAKIPDIGADQAKALTAALGKEIKGATAATKDATKATRDHTAALKNQGKATRDAGQETDQAAKSMKQLKEASSETGSSAAKLAGLLDRIAPGAGEAAIAVNDLADAGEVAAAASGALGISVGTLVAVAAPLALLVGGIALAWHDYSASAKEAAEFQERLNDALEPVDSIARATRDEIRELKVNLGQLTEAEAQDEKIRAAWADQLDAGTAKLREERDATQEQMAAIGTANAEYLKLQTRLEEVNGLIDTATTLNEQGTEAALANAMFTRERSESEQVLAERLKERTEAEQNARAAEAERAQVQALTLKGLLDEATAEQKREDAFLKATDALDKAHAQALAGVATEEERIALAAQAAREAATSAAVEAQAAAASSDERKRIARELHETLAAINEAELQDVLAAEQKKQDAAQATQDKIEASAYSSASNLMGAVASLADTVSQAAEQQGEESEKLARVAFGVSKGAAIGQAVITTAKASLDAYAAALLLGPPGLVLAPIAAGAAAGVGAAQIAAIAATPPPSFEDTPEVQHMGSGGLIRLAEGDYFAAAKDPMKLRQQVEGFTGEGAGQVNGVPPALFALPGPGLLKALAAPSFGDTPGVQRMGGNTPSPTRSRQQAPIVVVQQAGSVVDERVTRIRRGAPSELSRGLDRAAGTTVAKRRRS